MFPQDCIEYVFIPQRYSLMPPNLLDILRKGLAKLITSVGTWKDALKAKLAKYFKGYKMIKNMRT